MHDLVIVLIVVLSVFYSVIWIFTHGYSAWSMLQIMVNYDQHPSISKLVASTPRGTELVHRIAFFMFSFYNIAAVIDMIFAVVLYSHGDKEKPLEAHISLAIMDVCLMIFSFMLLAMPIFPTSTNDKYSGHCLPTHCKFTPWTEEGAVVDAHYVCCCLLPPAICYQAVHVAVCVGFAFFSAMCMIIIGVLYTVYGFYIWISVVALACAGVLVLSVVVFIVFIIPTGIYSILQARDPEQDMPKKVSITTFWLEIIWLLMMLTATSTFWTATFIDDMISLSQVQLN
jgi:hypothetical protein